MAKKKDKPKKVSAKKEKYSKFKREKSTTIDLSMPDLDDDATKLKRMADERIDKFLRFSKNKPPKEIVERKAKSKR
jgi:hypothetical protein